MDKPQGLRFEALVATGDFVTSQAVGVPALVLGED